MSSFRNRTAVYIAIAGIAAGAGLIIGAASSPDAARRELPVAPTIALGDGPLRFVPAPGGNEARYRVREQLARINFPSDAVGVTRRITGLVLLDEAGRLVPDSSTFVIDLASLQSDSDRRDNFLRRNTLVTEQHPTATFVVREIRGLANPLPSSGDHRFAVIGDLTLRDTTRPTVWQVVAAAESGGLRGTARTSFTFADFGLPVPRVASVLSVADEIRLEYDFHFVLDRATP